MYPDAVNLPFNGAVIKDGFVPVPPGSPDPGGAGFWVIIQKNSLVVAKTDSTVSLVEGDRPEWTEGQMPLYLGIWQQKPLRAVRIDSDRSLPPSVAAEPFNASEDRLDDRLLTLGGLGQQALLWDRHSRFCSRCGSRTIPQQGTWGRKCGNCSHEHFPHIHPCIIVLVKKGDSFLLARKPEWASGRYSLVAGFLDIGECLEECVHREVSEEVGVRISNVRYVGSQNWPFPSQLMAGYVAEYAGGDVIVDSQEIEDAQWFTADSLPGSLPPKRSIARWIIDTYALDPHQGRGKS